MRKIRLFIAMSLDGYIADSRGGVDWLNGQGDDEENIDAYSEFAKTIDTILMGWNTYHQVITELSPKEWIYKEFTTYVITHHEHVSSEQIRFVNTNPVELVKRLKKENGKDVWICGGANLIQQLVNEDLIDCYYITVIPTLLGSGTIYPRENYITVMVVVGAKEKASVEKILPRCTVELQDLYHHTQEGNGQRWLMIDLEIKDDLYHDLLQLIQIRRNP